MYFVEIKLFLLRRTVWNYFEIRVKTNQIEALQPFTIHLGDLARLPNDYIKKAECSESHGQKKR